MTIPPDPLTRAVEWSAAGRSVALATVVRTWGSAPRRPGSHMVIDDQGRFAGSVSGGCVEVAVVDEARRALEGAGPLLLHYGVADDQAWAVGLACGGSIEVLVTPVGPERGSLAPELLETVAAVGSGHPGVVVAYPLDGDSPRRVGEGSALFADEARGVRDEGEGRLAETTPTPTFLRPYLAPPRIIVVGAVHIAQPLVAMAALTGFDTVIIDPRPAFASPDRFPGSRCLDLHPADGLAAVDLDPRTAVGALTHNPVLDDPALLHAVRSPARYVGALGSRRTHARRLERLRAEGAHEDDLARIHAPIGLDLGGRSPEEIALAIVAEIVAVFRGGGGVKGSDGGR